jgi:alanine racemase
MSGPRATSLIEVSRSALNRNLHYVRRQVGPKVRITSVVKGNAYGHGVEQFVPLAEELGVRHFAVFEAREAWQVLACLRQTESRVMVMGMIADADIPWAIAHDVELYAFDLGRLEAIAAAAGSGGAQAKVHLELETGLNRTGLPPDQLESAVEIIRRSGERVVLEGLCTHLAGAESIANYLRIQHQIKRFHELHQRTVALGITPRWRHVACSAAALAYPETVLDMVRIGIVLYGYWPSQEIRIHTLGRTGGLTENPLRRVIRWSSRVMSLKHVPMGEFVGYGTTFLAARDSTVAVVPVGYAHGYARSLSNQGRVLVRGRRVGVIGMVNMNHVLVDVTSVPGATVGDEVVLIGSQGHSAIAVSSFSELSSQLNYELLTRLQRDIPRQIVD